MRDFEDFHITLAEKGGDLTWGTLTVYATGIELLYAEPVRTPEGHVERSYLLYKDQYAAIDALYRYPGALSEENRNRRAQIMRRTAQPGIWGRLKRRLLNWMAMVRDAVLQAVSLLIGAAKTYKPGAVILSKQEQPLKTLSKEIVGYAGNAYDPLLERHLFRRVVLEVSIGDQRYNFCGWLREYTSAFIELIDAELRHDQAAHQVLYKLHPGSTVLDGVEVSIQHGKLCIQNHAHQLIYVDRVESPVFRKPLKALVPPHYLADLHLPEPTEEISVYVGIADKVDIVVPRTHALVRHAAGEDGDTSWWEAWVRRAGNVWKKRKTVT